MPIYNVKVKDIPITKRVRHNVIKQDDDFIKLKTMLSNGLKPGEAKRVVLSSELLRKRKNAARLFKMAIVEYIRELNLPYDVKIRDINGVSPEIYVVARLPNIA